jgi:cyclophilin family peptidyl-prolyl cis-trans isomerase
MWWWIGGAVAALLAAAAAIWYLVGPGRLNASVQPTLTPAITQPVGSTPLPTETVASADSNEEESQMPAPPARNGMYSEPPEMMIDPAKSYQATISTQKGDILVDLDAAAAPQTVNNFVFLAREGFYDGLVFHRVEPGFVIQGGDPLGTGSGGPGYTVPAEIELKHIKGAIAMARRGDQVNPERASSGSQFYITLDPTPFLDEGYTAFGQVVEGMEVVESIAIGDVMESIKIQEG